jgi:antitoxin MazE
VKAHIIRIGNSKGIRIPHGMLQESRLEYQVELESKPGMLIVRPAKKARAGWAEAFEKMAERGDDVPPDPGFPDTRWSRKDWRW